MTIVGEYDFRVHAHLIAREGVELEQVAAVLSHPQPLAQCAGFLREQLPGVERRSVSSTAEAVRMVGESVRPWAAIGARAAAELYGCDVLREGIEDEADNVTRFVWIAPAGTEPDGEGPWRTSLVFSELGEDHPGRAGRGAAGVLQPRRQPLAGSSRGPLRQGLGRYMFFCDLEGALGDPAVAEALEALGKGRVGADPGLLPVRVSASGCVEFPSKMARVLVLNATYEPINVCTLRRAAVLLLKEKPSCWSGARGRSTPST